MSKKDYERIARLIRETLANSTGSGIEHVLMRDFAQRFAAEAGEDNPRFDDVRFMEAAGV